jgi:hypothetical protein
MNVAATVPHGRAPAGGIAHDPVDLPFDRGTRRQVTRGGGLGTILMASA